MSMTENSWKHEYITTNNIKLHYVTQGNGPLMLMLHGFPEYWYSWRHQIPEFARDYQVVAIDLRGYNDSDKPKEKSAYVMNEFIQDVKGVIQGLGYEKCVLVAHDWGGIIAWNFVDIYPETVEKLIILNLPHPLKLIRSFRTWKQLQKSWYIFFFQIPFLPELLLQYANYNWIEQMFAGIALGKSIFTLKDLKAYKQAVAKPGALRAMLNYYRNFFIPQLINKNWDIVAVPTLMIWGEEDKFLGKELTYGTEAYVRDFKIKYIPNCSHWVQQEQPTLVNQYMREFLRA
ncbi:alpha/beta hydrolase [Mastigocoleus sp. MO_188.B34]|uniref:alpha/beta fold hydrolase n=1 Tax=Mastigocoleus sp. MO_188.B34 TaxID=3036635 RepID=UPI002638BCDF|nr:alpha/beta hydrolase [Mastigocoleus sp. MO_188.B34]MDJ0693904.1 alpha/beta hydrolase [Mastigocoleus sp. MO_188.B34]